MSDSNTLIVVVSYENPNYTIQTVQHLCAQTHPVDIVLWDNASSSMTQAHLMAANFSGYVEREFSNENLLWTPAINHIMKQKAKDYEYIGFMNNDIYLKQDTVANMLQLLQLKQIGMVGPMGSRLGGISDYAHWYHVACKLGISEETFANSPIQGTYLIGACCFMRREVWDEVGSLDESMPLGADDHDYSIRIRNAGYQLWADPRSPADHVGHASGSSSNWNEWGQKSWDAFNEKWAGYYRTEREAIIAHWNGLYMPGWDVGTGWLTDEEREPIYALREKNHEHNLQFDKYKDTYKNMEWNGGF